MKRKALHFLETKHGLLILFSLLLTCSGHTQTTNTGTWNIINGFYKLNDTYTIWAEAQIRSQNLYSEFYYHQYKGGIFYNIPKSDNSLFIGAGRYTTYNYTGNFKSPVINDELRLWEQFTMNSHSNHFKLEQRYRLEHRWINTDFKSRLRYRINPIWVINHPTVVPHTFFLSAFDELFLGNNNPHLETNRYYLGMGYQFSKSVTLQMGCLHETNYSASGKELGKDYIQTTLQFFASHHSSKATNHGATIME